MINKNSCRKFLSATCANNCDYNNECKHRDGLLMKQRSRVWGNRDEISFAINILKVELIETKEEIESGKWSKEVLDLYIDNRILLELAIKKIEVLVGKGL